MTTSSPGFKSSDWATMLSPSVALRNVDDVVGMGTQFARERLARTAQVIHQLTAEELHGLAFKLQLPALVCLEYRSGTGAKGAMIEKNDPVPDQAELRKVAGHVSVPFSVGIEGIAQAVPEQGRREHRDRQSGSRETPPYASNKNMKFVPVLIIWPQLGVGGGTPIPRKLRLASSIMASGIASTKPTIMGEIELGIR